MRILIVFLLIFSFIYADENSTIFKANEYKISILRDKLNKISSKKLENEWTKTYSGFITHKALLDKKLQIQKDIKYLKSLRSLTSIQKKRLQSLKNRKKIIEDKINLIKGFEKDPFKKFITPPSLKDAPKITNPFAIISGLSYLKELTNKKNKYLEKYKTLQETIANLQEQKEILEEIVKLSNSSLDKQHLNFLKKELIEFLTIKDIFKTTKDIFIKKYDELKLSIENDIKKELQKVVYLGVILLFFIIIFIILKYLIRKYFAQKESFYTINKVTNISFISILILTLLFAYLENVSYLITFLGFASAGIAIALKDWFMSIMGWFVIVIGGAIHVGDRIKVVKGTTEYVGDVIDISLLRITIYEDITLTTYTHNRRAGRIIFIPNNYIFTDLIANYSHSGLKTVWDGIDIYLTFDSNFSKASTIAKNIAKQYAKGYTDITRKQLNKLRSKYQLKNANVEPRVFSFSEEYGIKISVWYLTNAYATLTLRSTISMKIIEEYLKEPDIKIAYPTQSIYLDKKALKGVNGKESS